MFGVVLVAVYGVVTCNGVLVHGARFGVYANVFLYFVMVVILWYGYFGHDFVNKYIVFYSDKEMFLIYLFILFWGGEKGALLFWIMVLICFSVIVVH